MWRAHIPPNSCQQGSCSTVLESFQSPINLGSGDLLICHTLGGSSVNDGISTSDSSVVYASIEDAAHFITTLGRGSFLGKMCVCQFHHITSCLLSLVNVPHYVVNWILLWILHTILCGCACAPRIILHSASLTVQFVYMCRVNGVGQRAPTVTNRRLLK